MTKCKFSASSIVVLSNINMHLVNDAQLLNDSWVRIFCAVVTISLLTKM